MLAATYTFASYGSFLTTSAAAEIFWAIFVVGVSIAVALFGVIGRRARREHRTRIYDLPPQLERRSPPAELYPSSSAKTRSTISPESPR